MVERDRGQGDSDRIALQRLLHSCEYEIDRRARGNGYRRAVGVVDVRLECISIPGGHARRGSSGHIRSATPYQKGSGERIAISSPARRRAEEPVPGRHKLEHETL